MKKAAILISTIFWMICFGVMHPAEAQQRIVEKSLSADSDERIRLNLKFGESIIVKGWDRDEVSFLAVVEINSGRLNDAFIANYVEDDQGIRIETGFNNDALKKGRSQDCPESKSHTYSRNFDGKNHVICSNISFEICSQKQPPGTGNHCCRCGTA